MDRVDAETVSDISQLRPRSAERSSVEPGTMRVVLPYRPRKWQLAPIRDQARRMVLVIHRRAGKSHCIAQIGFGLCLSGDRSHLPPSRRRLDQSPIRVVHVLPTRVMWDKTGMWDTLVRWAGAIPGAKVFQEPLRITFPGGAVYQCGGMDRADGWRGGYADLVIEDECDDVLAAGIDTVVSPMLADFSGRRIYSGTPKGNGRLASLYERAKAEAGWSHYYLRWQDTGVLDDRQLAQLRADMTEEEFAQELECSFTAPNSGSIYGKWLDAAEVGGRMMPDLQFDPRLPVYTAWDLGMDDATAIWWLQISPGGEWRWLDYHEDSGLGLDAYVRLVKGRGHNYKAHVMPHDVEVRELTQGGRSRRQYVEGLEMRPVVVCPAVNPNDRINAVRVMLPRCWFNSVRCAAGIKRLRAYHRAWNHVLGVWRSEPVHDESSHAADAFGHGVMGAVEPAWRSVVRRVRNQWDPYSRRA